MATLTIPFPPSVNRLWRQFRGRTILSKEGRQYREAVAIACPGYSMGWECDFEVSIKAWMPDGRRRDLDNLLKASLDGITHVGLWKDDSQIIRLSIEKAGIDRVNPRLELEIFAANDSGTF